MARKGPVTMSPLTKEQLQMMTRWRLVLGNSAEQRGICISDDDTDARRIEALVGYLFEDSAGGKAAQDRTGGTGPGHAMNVPRWLDEVQRLFPREAKEVMERELVNRKGLRELMQKPEILERIEPNQELVKTLLTHRDLLNEKTRSLARKIIEKVVQELKQKLKVQIEPAITGASRRDRHSPRRVYRNLDLKRTIRRNLHNYHADSGRLLVDRL